MRQILLAAAAVSLLAAGQASAHARLLKSSPAKGATVAAPKALTLTFSEEIVAAKSSVAVTKRRESGIRESVRGWAAATVSEDSDDCGDAPASEVVR